MSKITYKDSGVDVAAADHMVKWIKKVAKPTVAEHNVFDFGAYASVVEVPGSDMMIAATCDGVGTKLLLAKQTGRFKGIGKDLVAMNVNDLVAVGARPLAFLDYFSVGKIEVGKDMLYFPEIISGMADACIEAGCVLLGGETAEMPGMYKDKEFDLAGFAIGIVDRSLISNEPVKPGDAIIALPSRGLHSNGYSLVRKIIEDHNVDLEDPMFPGTVTKLSEILMTPTRIYTRDVINLMSTVDVKAAAHITGGGLVNRIKGIIPEGYVAEIDSMSWTPPIVFRFLEEHGVSEHEMRNTFNMGLGFVAIIHDSDMFDIAGTDWIKIGTVAKFEPKVVIK